MFNLINKLYNWMVNTTPITKLNSVSDCEVLFWASDFTHLREQLPLIYEINKKYKAGLVTNKKFLIDYLKRNNIKIKVGYLQFGKAPKYAIDKVIKKYLPKLRFAIIGNDLRIDDSKIADALVQLKIPYGIISHGMSYLSAKLHVSKANLFYVWTKQEKDIMIAQGIAPERVILSGSPYLETLKSDIKIAEYTFLNKSFEVGNRVKILIAISGPGGISAHDQFNEIITDLNTTAQEQKETHFFLNKLHRKDRKSNYIGKGFLNVVDDDVVPEHISKLVPLLCDVDIVISGASTSVIEAMLLQKPIIIFDKNPQTRMLPFVIDQSVLFCTDMETLKKHIISLNEPAFLEECINKQNKFMNAHFNVAINPVKFIAQEIIAQLDNNKYLPH